MADYQTFVQKNGPRAGQKYRVKRGASGLNVRVYESGDTALSNKSRQPVSANRPGGPVRRNRYQPR